MVLHCVCKQLRAVEARLKCQVCKYSGSMLQVPQPAQWQLATDSTAYWLAGSIQHHTVSREHSSPHHAAAVSPNTVGRCWSVCSQHHRPGVWQLQHLRTVQFSGCSELSLCRLCCAGGHISQPVPSGRLGNPSPDCWDSRPGQRAGAFPDPHLHGPIGSGAPMCD